MGQDERFDAGFGRDLAGLGGTAMGPRESVGLCIRHWLGQAIPDQATPIPRRRGLAGDAGILQEDIRTGRELRERFDRRRVGGEHERARVGVEPIRVGLDRMVDPERACAPGLAFDGEIAVGLDPLDVLDTRAVVEPFSVGDVLPIDVGERREQPVGSRWAVHRERFSAERPARDDEVEEIGVVVHVLVGEKQRLDLAWMDAVLDTAVGGAWPTVDQQRLVADRERDARARAFEGRDRAAGAENRDLHVDTVPAITQNRSGEPVDPRSSARALADTAGGENRSRGTLERRSRRESSPQRPRNTSRATNDQCGEQGHERCMRWRRCPDRRFAGGIGV